MDFPSSSSRLKEVTGKERVKYYSRPVLPGNQSTVPLIKYAPDVSQAQDDFTAEFLARRDSYSKVRRSVFYTAQFLSVFCTVQFLSSRFCTR